MTKDCSEVLHQLQVFLDNELDQASCTEIQTHLAECGPCLEKYNLDKTVKAVVARACNEVAPQELRERVRVSYTQVTITETD